MMIKKQLLKFKLYLMLKLDEEKKQILQKELDLFEWRKNIFKMKEEKTGLDRDKRDIITDYYPEEIGHATSLERTSFSYTKLF